MNSFNLRHYSYFLSFPIFQVFEKIGNERISQIQRIHVFRVKFSKACDLSIKFREAACVLRVKYRIFSLGRRSKAELRILCYKHISQLD